MLNSRDSAMGDARELEPDLILFMMRPPGRGGSLGIPRTD